MPEALNSFNNPNTTINTFNIDLDTTIALISDSEKKEISEIEAQLVELKDYVNCELSILFNKNYSFTASL